jgi:cystine transport system substrate-binding protein
MPHRRTVLLAGVLAVLSALPAAAQSRLDEVKAAGVLKIGTEGTYAPFTFHDAKNDLVGFDVEIGRAVAEKIGVKPQFLEGKCQPLRRGHQPGRHHRRPQGEV